VDADVYAEDASDLERSTHGTIIRRTTAL
jgi:hypothetical protein